MTTLRRMTLAVAGLPLLLLAATPFHLDLLDSFPDEEEVLTEAPETVWLEFSGPPDMSRSSFSVRGPDGAVSLGEIQVGEQPEVIQANVQGAMPPGTYTVAWVAAPMDDHAVRGRFEFSVESTEDRR